MTKTLRTPLGLSSPSDPAEDRGSSLAPAAETKADATRSLERLWDLYASELYSVALWRCNSIEDAKDAVQDVFLHLARRPHLLSRVKNLRPSARKFAP